MRLRGDSSENEKGTKKGGIGSKRDKKRLKKLLGKDKNVDGFISCGEDSQRDFIEQLKEPSEELTTS